MGCKEILIWFGIAVGICMGSLPAGVQPPDQPTFRIVNVVVGVPTTDILAEFLNNDDHLDLLVVGDQRVFTLQGRGDGRFDIIGAIHAGEGAVELAAADFSGDGLMDLAVANHDTDHVTLLFGVADGGFQRRPSSRFVVKVSPHPHAVHLADLDADGRVELLVDHRDAEAIRFFRTTEDGEFAHPGLIPVGGDPYRGMFVTDITRDGFLDILTPNPDHVAIWFNDGTGGFRQGPRLHPGFAPFSAIAADINGDGLMDVAAGSFEGAGALAIWFGLPDGGFQARGKYELAAGPTKMASAHLNGDQRADLIVTCYVGGEVAVLVGGKTPTLRRMKSAGKPYGVTSGDFNGDGKGDFAIANDGVDYITVFLSKQ